jgi:hypothetical protein
VVVQPTFSRKTPPGSNWSGRVAKLPLTTATTGRNVVKEMDTELPKKVHIGVAAINSSDTPYTVEFEDLKVEDSK